ncbi:Probable 2-oxoglutarate dehydrogenase SucA [Mycobacteroides abscessus subsp. abscessus]|nr:Probable 2-oxoglutarate dehydrogenase SucA [Mycobacteroides abscessus subsp. abscessus]
MRIEQLYPIPRYRLEETLSRYPDGAQYIWVQEEPANQGAWPTSSKVHAVEQQEIIDEAFAPTSG